ncbi:MAG: hypothetical protein RLZ71_90 [Actinomycetota bacterium]|jgi:hypothetical protein
MVKLFKLVTATIASIALALTGAVAANATTTHTLAEFQALPLYQEILANTATTSAAITSASALKLETRVSMQSMGVEAANANAVVESTPTASHGSISISVFGSAPESVDFGFLNGQYYSPMPEAVDLPEVKNLSASLTRLKKRDAEYLVSVDNFAPSEAGELDPSKLYSSATADPLQGIGEALTGATFGDITKLNALEGLTSYQFTVTTLAGAGVPAMSFDVQLDYVTATGILKNQVVTSNVMGLVVYQTSTLVIGGTVSVPTALPTYSVKLSDIVAMDSRIKAEASLATKVKTLSAKAIALAKKAKKAVSGTYISAAAKSLKYVSTAIKNGVKLSAKVSGVTGSVCVAAAGGKVVTSNC